MPTPGALHGAERPRPLPWGDRGVPSFLFSLLCLLHVAPDLERGPEQLLKFSGTFYPQRL